MAEVVVAKHGLDVDNTIVMSHAEFGDEVVKPT